MKLTILTVLGLDDVLESCRDRCWSVPGMISQGTLQHTVVGLGSHLHGLLEVLGSGGEDHELLESEGVSGVGSTVDNVESGGRENEGSLDAGKVGEVLVEGDVL